MRLQLEKCFLCHLPVLGLEGQYEFLDTYFLQGNDEALVEKAYGACHTACLVASRWGRFWARRQLEQRTQVRRQPVVGEDHGLTALRNPNMRETLILSSNGQVWSVLDKDLQRAKATEGGVFIPIEGEYNLHLAGYPQIAAEVRDGLLKHKRYPIPKLLELLGIADKMIAPQALEGGELRFDRGMKRRWAEDSIAAKIGYAQFLPEDVFALAQEGQRQFKEYDPYRA